MGESHSDTPPGTPTLRVWRQRGLRQMMVAMGMIMLSQDSPTAPQAAASAELQTRTGPWPRARRPNEVAVELAQIAARWRQARSMLVIHTKKSL